MFRQSTDVFERGLCRERMMEYPLTVDKVKTGVSERGSKNRRLDNVQETIPTKMLIDRIDSITEVDTYHFTYLTA